MKYITALFLLIASLAIPASAQTSGPASPILVELFASQNCRACPKAHETLKAVNAVRDDVLILTWSVDYWDYLGEADPMALKDSKMRQAAYVDRFKLRGPYTPQTVYHGIKQCAGNKPKRVEAALKAFNNHTSPVALRLDGNTVHLTGTVSTASDILLVSYLGPNAHETDMLNPVTSVKVLAAYAGGDVEFDRSECETDHCAVIVQAAAYGDVLAAIDLAP